MTMREAAKYAGVRYQTVQENVHLLLEMLGDDLKLKRGPKK